MKFHQTAINPYEHFDEPTVKATYAFIKKHTPEEIRKFRHAYQRELNEHMGNPKNSLPQHTVEKRRCFLYITQSYAK